MNFKDYLLNSSNEKPLSEEVKYNNEFYFAKDGKSGACDIVSSAFVDAIKTIEKKCKERDNSDKLADTDGEIAKAITNFTREFTQFVNSLEFGEDKPANTEFDFTKVKLK